MNNKTNNRITPIEISFFEDQLHEAQRNLFSARSVKQVRFLTNRINFLKQQLKELKSRRK